MAISTADFEMVRALVRQRSAIVIEPDKAYLVENRLLALTRTEGFDSLDQLFARLRQAANGLAEKVVDAMTTNETYFFRDVHPFEGLKRQVLPSLIKARATERRLNVWSAACSTGQEVYSIAMLLRENFPELIGWQVTLQATDLSPSVLRRAAEGRYTQMEVNRGLPVRLLVKYFRQEGTDWMLNDDVRRMVQFRPHNLIGPWPAMAPMDVVMLRNVLIYFDVPTRKDILAKVRRCLRPDGYLFLGASETTLNLDDSFERVDSTGTNCYRLKPAVVTPSRL